MKMIKFRSTDQNSEDYARLGYYAASSDNYLPTIRDNRPQKVDKELPLLAA
jgi:hypothetical protein